MKHRPRTVLFLLIISLLGLAARPAGAQTPYISQGPADATMSFSPTVMVQASSSIVLAAGGYKGRGCVVFTELTRSPPLSLPAKNIDYGLFSENGSLQLSTNGSPASAQETLEVTFPSNAKPKDRFTLLFLVEVFPTSLPPSRTHTITLRADLYAHAYPPSGPIADSVNFTVNVQVNTYYDVSVVPSGGAFSLSSTTATLAFGTLAANATRGADILVKSNVSYTLSLTSASGGALVNVSDGTRLAYSLTANGSIISLPAGTRKAVASGVSPGFGTPTRYALVVTVLPYAILPNTGAYSDTITVTLAAP
jgi:spore coat protein U-like protein